MISGAEGLGGHHPQTNGKAGRKGKNQIAQAPAGANRRQSVGAHEVAHHQGIHQIIKLLKEIADQQRDCK